LGGIQLLEFQAPETSVSSTSHFLKF